LVLLEDEPITDAEPGEITGVPASVTTVGNTEASSASAQQRVPPGQVDGEETEGDDGQPGEEDTDAADLLVIYELADEVLVVDEQPRYHLARCRWPDHERAEPLPVCEARQLGFTPCDRCRPDTILARKYRAGRATTTAAAEPGSSQ